MTQQPTNPNFLNQHRFRVVIQRLPNVVYFCQKVNIPGISAGNASQATPFQNLPVPGDKVTWADFRITFVVDEDMRNYKEIANWILGLTFPKQYGQHADLEKSDGLESDITVMILDSNNQPAHTVRLLDAFPVSISDIELTTTTSDTEVVPVTATFKYSMWELDNDVNQNTATKTDADR